MEVEQMQHCEIRNKHRVERAIIMAAGNARHAETADPRERCPYD